MNVIDELGSKVMDKRDWNTFQAGNRPKNPNSVTLRGSECVLLLATERKSRPRRAALTTPRTARNEKLSEEKHGGTMSWN